MHLSLSNDLRSNILQWPIEGFSRINIINNNTIESLPTPLTSLKQLLGIRTQDTTILEPILTSDPSSSKEDYQQ